MNRIIAFLIFALGLLCGCSALPGVKWGGAYAGIQNVGPVRGRTFTEDTVAADVNFIFLLGSGWSFQAQPIIPLNHPDEVLFRMEIAKRIF